MLIFNRIQELENHLDIVRNQQKKVGFVPTMGALHQGHLALVKQSKAETDVTVCSIFVNPTQFNDPKDLEKYPRTLEKDSKLLESVDCDVLFAPEVNDIYNDKELEDKRLGIENKDWTKGKKVDFGHLRN